MTRKGVMLMLCLTRGSSRSPAQEIVGVTESLYQLTDGHPGSEEERDIGGAIATSGHRGPGVISAECRGPVSGH